MKLILVILSLMMFFSCSKEDQTSDNCPNGSQIIFKVKCDNCTINNSINVKIQGNGLNNTGNAIIASNAIHEIPMIAYNPSPSYQLLTQTSSGGPLLTQSSGEVIMNSCTEVVSITVYY